MNNQSTPTKQNTTKYLIYAAMILILLNLILIFLPAFEDYGPSHKKTDIFGNVTYIGWKKATYSMIQVQAFFLVVEIPYLLTLINFILSYLTKKDYSSFMKVLNSTAKKPFKFWWLKASAILNIVVMVLIYDANNDWPYEVEKAGAYFRFTFWGILQILFSVALVAILFYLSKTSKEHFKFVQIPIEEVASPIEASASESENNEENNA